MSPHQSTRGVQHGESHCQSNPIQTRTDSVGLPSGKVPEGGQTHPIQTAINGAESARIGSDTETADLVAALLRTGYTPADRVRVGVTMSRTVTITDNFCDWNPTEDRPTLIGDEWHGEAEWSVGPREGHDYPWRLCRWCAVLRRFGNINTRSPLGWTKKPSLPVVAVVVGVPRVNDQSSRAAELLGVFSRLSATKRFDAMHGMYADVAPRIAAKVYSDGASSIIALSSASRRACRSASKRCAVPMLYWDRNIGRLVDDRHDVPQVGDRLTQKQAVATIGGQCPVCLARDEYDRHEYDRGQSLWVCMACPAQFELTLGPRGGVEDAVRTDDADVAE